MNRASVVALILVAALPAQDAEPETVELRNGFHIAGVPGVKRHARVDLVLAPQFAIIRRGKAEVLRIQYDRISSAQWLNGERQYAKSTYALVVTVGAPGALLLMKKRKVDTIIFEFTNPRGGLMSAVLQVPKGDGMRCKQRLADAGVNLTEPPLVPVIGGLNPETK